MKSKPTNKICMEMAFSRKKDIWFDKIYMMKKKIIVDISMYVITWNSRSTHDNFTLKTTKCIVWLWHKAITQQIHSRDFQLCRHKCRKQFGKREEKKCSQKVHVSVRDRYNFKRLAFDILPLFSLIYFLFRVNHRFITQTMC